MRYDLALQTKSSSWRRRRLGRLWRTSRSVVTCDRGPFMSMFSALDWLSDFLQRCGAFDEPKHYPSDDNRGVPKVKEHQDLLHVNQEKSKKRKKKREHQGLPNRLRRLKIRIFGWRRTCTSNKRCKYISKFWNWETMLFHCLPWCRNDLTTQRCTEWQWAQGWVTCMSDLRWHLDEGYGWGFGDGQRTGEMG